MATDALQSATEVAEAVTRQETPQREGMRHGFQGVGFAVEVNVGLGTQPTAQSVHAEVCCIMVALHTEVTAGRCAIGNIEKATGQQRQEFLDESADGWFYNYYTKSTFYRLRQRAIHEFMDCLNV